MLKATGSYCTFSIPGLAEDMTLQAEDERIFLMLDIIEINTVNEISNVYLSTNHY